MTQLPRTLCLVMSIFVLAACASAPKSRYTMRVDSAPITLIPDHEPSIIVPQYEPYRLANMRPYTIRGIDYQPILSGKGVIEKGYASWYGQKFHGHLTSNGEVFDMYEFTAAHKTLPLPSYARVTNDKNNKSIIVRINDRGPFHHNRILDLSFAAAKELDYLSSGTAKITLEVIHVDEDNMVTVANNPSIPLDQYLDPSPIEHKSNQLFIQIAAFNDKAKAESLAQAANVIYQHPATISSAKNKVYRTLIGPIDNRTLADALLLDVKGTGYDQAFIYLSD
jgi:rare lipoprotein A